LPASGLKLAIGGWKNAGGEGKAGFFLSFEIKGVNFSRDMSKAKLIKRGAR